MTQTSDSGFGGATFDEKRDGARLRSQLSRVGSATSDGGWHTLAELAAKCGGTEAAISARLRDLRKPKFGGLVVERAHIKRGLWKYRVVGA